MLWNVIQSTNGEDVSYDQLILAIGADQIRLPMQGDAVGKIYTVNALDDYQTFYTALAEKKCVSNIGAGLIGCEFANDLAIAGYRVHVIDISLEPLGRLLPPEAGAFFRHKLEAAGVMDLYPAIDLRGGRCVRLYQGDYAQETVYGDDPVAQARFYDSAGADELVFLDITATHEARSTVRNWRTLRSLAQVYRAMV